MPDALIIVDMQEAAVANGRQHDLDAVIDRINRLSAAVRAADGTVIFVQHDGETDDPFAPGSAGWNISSRLVCDPRDWHVRKHTNDAFHQTALDELLRALYPSRVIVCGWATDFCVDGTVRSAVARGYHVVAVSDAHTCDTRPHLPAKEVIAHHNWVWSGLIAPGIVQVVPAARVFNG